MTRVMIAVDGSELDAPLLATSYRVFGPDADYWAVNVQDPGVSPLGGPTTFPATYGAPVGFGTAYPVIPPDPYRSSHATGGHEAVVESDEALQRADATAHSAVRNAGLVDAEPIGDVGDPPAAILHAARQHGIDVIVVGDHDRSWWSRLFAPAVGSKVIDHAEVPVMVVSRSAADRAPADDVSAEVP